VSLSLFKGTYVFKQNGLEIGRTNNLITSNGRNLILEFLAGARQNWAADMAIGAMPTHHPLQYLTLSLTLKQPDIQLF
jgi:hypothetical protein